MSNYDAEISIRDVNCLNRKIFQEGWMYVSTPTGKEVPPYFARTSPKQIPIPAYRRSAVWWQPKLSY